MKISVFLSDTQKVWLSRMRAKLAKPTNSIVRLATVTFDKVGDAWAVTRSELDVVGTVPGLDEAGFDAAAQNAKDNCPISRALAGNVEMTVSSTVEDGHS